MLFCLAAERYYCPRTIVLLNPSDSVLFYSQQTREANNTVRSTIKLRCNKTRRMANKTGVVSLRVQRLSPPLIFYLVASFKSFKILSFGKIYFLLQKWQQTSVCSSSAISRRPSSPAPIKALVTLSVLQSHLYSTS